MATSDPRPPQNTITLKVVEGRPSPSSGPVQLEPAPEKEVLRWKTWTAVLLAVIFVLVTMHMDGPKFLGSPDLGPEVSGR